MGKVAIIMACGCQETHDIVGKVKDRDKKAERIAERVCSACLKKANEKENVEAEKKSAEYGLIPLVGTPKQVAWATTIRLHVAEAAFEKKGVEATIERFNAASTSASWWIDNREELLRRAR